MPLRAWSLSSPRWTLQGVMSLALEATAICGLLKSSSVNPTARNMERAGARSLPSTTTEECGRGNAEGCWHMGLKRETNQARREPASPMSAWFSGLLGLRRVLSVRSFPRMAFNLKLVLKALLFSSSQPLSIKDIQAVFARFHDQSPAAPAEAGGEPGDPADAPAPEIPTEAADELAPEPNDADLYADVPSLITATQIREAMDGLAAELKELNDIYLLIEGAQGYRLVTHPRFA